MTSIESIESFMRKSKIKYTLLDKSLIKAACYDRSNLTYLQIIPSDIWTILAPMISNTYNSHLRNSVQRSRIHLAYALRGKRIIWRNRHMMKPINRRKYRRDGTKIKTRKIRRFVKLNVIRL